MKPRGWSCAKWVEKFKAYRITFAYPVLDAAACATFLVAGEDKASALHKVWEDPSSGLPAQRVHLKHGRLIWLLDRAATSGFVAPLGVPVRSIRNQAQVSRQSSISFNPWARVCSNSRTRWRECSNS
jgi:Glucosamine-6-phosphate isomerases/6-phosphogluconolactonase